MVWTRTCLDSSDATQQFFKAKLQFGELNRTKPTKRVCKGGGNFSPI